MSTTRPPWTFFVAALAILLGMAGLVRGSIPQSSASTGGAAPTTASASPIVVGGAYVREPANDVNAAAYFTVYNTTGTPDRLMSITSGAGAVASLHDYSASGGMIGLANGLEIPAHGSVVLTPGKVHVMIEKLYGPIKVGQTVNLQLSFADAGDVLVTAPVIALTAPAPTAAGGTGSPSPSASAS
ncbi:copper chaperone PCu(A)C [Jatrophihabitans telluris]|uniref:Copper chaperone PCu(A)C n=1 Tax=Jatrophihabitans telluris TaxID=2038343 RepID=A0ABY4QVH0_9ACTN|nr:copper chaperone PCu(A)C [Jatrophihabitans telluris]UQX87656.1 copper chaperone PCu(A)C [Jatrophihabitans telluris]